MKINDLANHQKPRERMLNYGASHLSHAELLAILINTGRKGYSSLDIANELLKSIVNLKELKHLSINDLNKIKGVGLYKALTLKAAFELGERMHSGSVDDKIQINNPKDAADFMMGKMEHLTQEKFIALFLNSKNIIIKQKTIFMGTLNSAIVHPREIYSEAVKCASNTIIVLHNHPSGDTTPSLEDIKTTDRLRECGDILGIQLLDHVIIGDHTYLSMVEEGYFDI
ncbi:RadC family protein [Staphylococcus saprophyticus]|jgi:DNA repair protein RadC|uniref:RadC family protein n=1 Tax=Staphylococcus saprophyticus TaxID=29385 RepID=UPI0016428E16|nr:DNA repair protein RadC [Staphylococcus saprophyticus]MBC2920667.1 DNA repair protein RadC [Staphylococcus saprophyticus]MBC2956371.1 DNA repair protein RadC [Staphylococcus saprophyticus]MBC3009505.1 DNA repair protein RadC [Staphylococcus saprophyticus]MBC3023384.1 DNA repair protein RadC [Staphylococcus saprophyticus]MBC3029355.1 DNA repair protein RadC [Staphylococcus saprophyticus]